MSGVDNTVREQIDACGLFCPVPLTLLGKALRSRQPGERVELLGDDPGLDTDMEDWTRANKHRIIARRLDGRTRTFIVEKG